MAVQTAASYPATLDVAYPERLSRLTTFFRIILAIPALFLVSLVTLGAGALALAVVLMLLFRGRYPRVWFEWSLYTMQYTQRANAYLLLLTDQYPSTTDHQSVSATAILEEGRLARALPLVKWLLALPHFVLLYFLGIAAGVCVVIGWFAILITGRFPRGLFGFVVGVLRWQWRVSAYTTLLGTDRYPPFSLR